jgi:hypothetical protein
MTKHTQNMRDSASAPTLREVVARLETMLAESKEDAEKCALHFGRFETSEGNK